MAQYEAIFFDFDGVLCDSEPVHWQCWLEVIAPFGYSVSWEDFRRNCVGVHEHGTVEWLRNQRTPPVPFEELWSRYPLKKDLFRQKMLGTDAIAPPVIELLRVLRKDYALAVVTSSNQREVEPVLAAAGVLGLFKAAVYGGDVANLKPAPDPYLLAGERTGTRKALVVEDSAPGIASGQAAGFEVLAIPSQPQMCSLVARKLGVTLQVPAPVK